MAEPDRTIRFTNLDKVLFLQKRITKGDLVRYYIRLAPRMIPYLEGRAVMLHRFPDGIGQPGFYVKNAPPGTPPWVTTTLHHSVTAGRDIRYIVCDRPETLAWLANMASVELHITLSGVKSPEVPQFAFFDLDPEPPDGFPEARAVALELRDLMRETGNRPYVKTSGKRGLHVLVPLREDFTFPVVRDAVHALGIILSRKLPGVASDAAKARGGGMVLVDYAQNAAWKTMICPYSLRAREEATVSTPLSWEELEAGVRPEDFNIETVSSRQGDPWDGIVPDRQDLWVERP